jgi:hypothetical protein
VIVLVTALLGAMLPAIYHPSWRPWLRLIGTAYTVVILIVIVKTVPAWLGLPG